VNILHLSDLHFGPRHWEGDDQILLEKINSFKADIVINTGDSTTDGLEDEYAVSDLALHARPLQIVL
jgi:3',5'-cyclic AMP phosphodiesterase CpdA